MAQTPPLVRQTTVQDPHLPGAQLCHPGVGVQAENCCQGAEAGRPPPPPSPDIRAPPPITMAQRTCVALSADGEGSPGGWRRVTTSGWALDSRGYMCWCLSQRWGAQQGRRGP